MSFNFSGLSILKVVGGQSSLQIPTDPIPVLTDSFEFSDGWSGTLSNPFPEPSFTTPALAESFEFAESWPGTAA